MANPKKKKHPTAAARSAIQDALNLRDTNAPQHEQSHGAAIDKASTLRAEARRGSRHARPPVIDDGLLSDDAPAAAKTTKAHTEQQPRRWLSRIGGGGRVVVPAELRQEMGLKEGDAVVFEAAEGTVVVKSQMDVVRELQKKYGKVWQGSEFSSESFLAERKAIWGEE